MRISLWSRPQDGSERKPASTNRARRGATAMEYLVVISFILVVVIVAVQHIGSITGGLLGNSAKATNFSSGSTGS